MNSHHSAGPISQVVIGSLILLFGHLLIEGYTATGKTLRTQVEREAAYQKLEKDHIETTAQIQARLIYQQVVMDQMERDLRLR